jgi:hypothetical protein
MLVMFIQQEKLARHLYEVHTSDSTEGKLKSSVTNDETVITTLTFWTYQKILKLILSS